MPQRPTSSSRRPARKPSLQDPDPRPLHELPPAKRRRRERAIKGLFEAESLWVYGGDPPELVPSYRSPQESFAAQTRYVRQRAEALRTARLVRLTPDGGEVRPAPDDHPLMRALAADLPPVESTRKPTGKARGRPKGSAKPKPTAEAIRTLRAESPRSWEKRAWERWGLKRSSLYEILKKSVKF